MKRRRNYPTLLPIHLACSDDELRPAMNCVWINAGIAYATNAHVLAVVDLNKHSDLTPLQVEMLHGKMIHKSVWKRLLKEKIVDITSTGIVVSSDYSTIEYRFAEPNYKFPDVIRVLNDHISAESPETKFFGIDPKYIEIASAIIPKRQCLFFHNKGDKGFLLRSDDDWFAGMFVLVMPVMTNGQEDKIFNFKFF